MKPIVPFVVVATVSLAPTLVHAQAAEDAVRTVDAALGRERAVMRRAERHRGAARDWTVPLRTRRGSCYEVIARAVGDARVSLTLQARHARIADEVPIANGTEVARTRFCASLPGSVYSALVHSDGATQWALALRTAPAGEAQASSAPPANATSAAPSTAPSSSPPPLGVVANLPVGGVENDFVGQQIRTAMQNRSARAIVPAERVSLATNEARTIDLPLTASHCIVAIAAGVPSATDVNLEIVDPAGNRVAEDSGHRGVESVSYCPPYSGRYRLTVRMFSGRGLTGIQAFEVH
jgi:hypothetical protein